MAHYGIKKNEDGTRTMVPYGAEGPPVEVPKPEGTTLEGGQVEVIECEACGLNGQLRKFKRPAIMANHFKKSHADLYEDKDSWRKYARKITE
jgi:hypothetical protein